MGINNKINNIFAFFIGRRKIVDNFITEEATYFYDRCDKTLCAYNKKVFNLMVCSIMSETYEQLMFGADYKAFHSLNVTKQSTGRRIYKLCIMYILIVLRQGESTEHIADDFSESNLKNTFGFTPREIKEYKRFGEQSLKTPDLFTLNFCKHFTKAVFPESKLSQFALALTTNILYNSYERFVETYEMYARRSHAA